MHKTDQQKQTLILVSFQSLIFTWDQIYFIYLFTYLLYLFIYL